MFSVSNAAPQPQWGQICQIIGDRYLPCFLSIIDPLLLKSMNNKLRYEPKRRQLEKAQSMISGHYRTKITLRKCEEASYINSWEGGFTELAWRHSSWQTLRKLEKSSKGLVRYYRPVVNLEILMSTIGTRNKSRLLFVQYIRSGKISLGNAWRGERVGQTIMKRPTQEK